MKLLSICIFINASMQVKYYAYARYASEMKTGGLRKRENGLVAQQIHIYDSWLTCAIFFKQYLHF